MTGFAKRILFDHIVSKGDKLVGVAWGGGALHCFRLTRINVCRLACARGALIPHNAHPGGPLLVVPVPGGCARECLREACVNVGLLYTTRGYQNDHRGYQTDPPKVSK